MFWSMDVLTVIASFLRDSIACRVMMHPGQKPVFSRNLHVQLFNRILLTGSTFENALRTHILEAVK